MLCFFKFRTNHAAHLQKLANQSMLNSALRNGN